jgi:hypothetical protein
MVLVLIIVLHVIQVKVLQLMARLIHLTTNLNLLQEQSNSMTFMVTYIIKIKMIVLIIIHYVDLWVKIIGYRMQDTLGNRES